jgi:transketolase
MTVRNSTSTTAELRTLAARIRRDALAMIFNAGSGHPGGSLSCADMLAVLVKDELNWSSQRPAGAGGDRFVLSKGHACPALYAAAAHCGLLEAQELTGFRKLGRKLQGHPHVVTTPFAQTSTGSLAQGFSVALGMALGLRLQGSAARVYVMVGDGELQEGQVWEAIMCAGHYALDNLCVLVDYNRMQSDDLNENVMGLEPLARKWDSFNWHAVEVDGHDMDAIRDGFAQAANTCGKPTVLLAHTQKGKGVSFMEGSPLWHGSVKLRAEELQRALQDLGTPEADIARYLAGQAWQD